MLVTHSFWPRSMLASSRDRLLDVAHLPPPRVAACYLKERLGAVAGQPQSDGNQSTLGGKSQVGRMPGASTIKRS